MLSELKKQMSEYLMKRTRKDDVDKINICAWIFKFATSNIEYSSDIIEFFLSEADFIESDNSINPESSYTSADIISLRKAYGDIVDITLEGLLKKNYDEETFYAELWKSIQDTPLLNGKDCEASKSFALYYIWIDSRIPYFHLDEGLAMSNEEFASLSKKQEKIISQARFIVRTNLFESRTERAKVLLNLLESIQSDKERTVIMAHIMSFLNFWRPETLNLLLRQIERDDSITSSHASAEEK